MPSLDLPASHPALRPGATAVVTGAAGGIGLAAAGAFARAGLNVVMADLAGEKLEKAQAAVAGMAAKPSAGLAVPTDVSRSGEGEHLRTGTQAEFGVPALPMNNAGGGLNPAAAARDLAAWKRPMGGTLW